MMSRFNGFMFTFFFYLITMSNWISKNEDFNHNSSL
jgi:hypothetical protein